MSRPMLLATTVGGLCLALVACESPSGAGLTEPETRGQTAPSGAAAGSALTFNGTWRTMPPLQPARWRHAADVLGKSIVVVGGLSGDELHALSRVDAFNVETRTWTALKSLPIPLYDVNGATPVQGKLYVSGGRSSPDEDCAKTLFVYDPATKSWTRKADMPFKGCLGVQAHVHGHLYVYTFPQSPPDIRLFASYNPKTDKWVRRPPPKACTSLTQWPAQSTRNSTSPAERRSQDFSIVSSRSMIQGPVRGPRRVLCPLDVLLRPPPSCMGSFLWPGV